MDDDVTRDEFLSNWRKRITEDINELRRIKVVLLNMAASREDAELAQIAYELHIARCHLANTITLRFGADIIDSINLGECNDDDIIQSPDKSI